MSANCRKSVEEFTYKNYVSQLLKMIEGWVMRSEEGGLRVEDGVMCNGGWEMGYEVVINLVIEFNPLSGFYREALNKEVIILMFLDSVALRAPTLEN